MRTWTYDGRDWPFIDDELAAEQDYEAAQRAKDIDLLSMSDLEYYDWAIGTVISEDLVTS